VSVFAQRFPHLGAPTSIFDAVEVGDVDIVALITVTHGYSNYSTTRRY
jgi:hypothetical protein